MPTLGHFGLQYSLVIWVDLLVSNPFVFIHLSCRLLQLKLNEQSIAKLNSLEHKIKQFPFHSKIRILPRVKVVGTHLYHCTCLKGTEHEHKSNAQHNNIVQLPVYRHLVQECRSHDQYFRTCTVITYTAATRYFSILTH